jgi:ectonucleotide pyrophosphatase/phosphodiesterase family member 5
MKLTIIWPISIVNWFLFVTITCLPSANRPNKSRVLLVSFDGFRLDYLNKSGLQNFKWVAQRGVVAEDGMENTFKTATFATHFTMATGLYQESHGIVGNTFFDKRLNQSFVLPKASTEHWWWQEAEPIWITTTRAGIPSGTMFWSGSEVDYGGLRQLRYLNYNESITFTERIDQVIEWMTKDHLRMVTLYFNEPDKSGHGYGPDSPEVDAKVREVDQALGYLLQQLHRHGLFNETNVILVADHGMENVRLEDGVSLRVFNDHAQSMGLPQLDENQLLATINDGFSLNFYLKSDSSTLNKQFTKQLKRIVAAYNSSFYTVYTREEMPDRWHYKGHKYRVADVMILAEPGHYIYDKALPKIPSLNGIFGRHGYDNKHRSMRPFCMMMGPGFHNTPREIKHWHQVDIYGLITQLLDVPIQFQRPTNGSLSRIKLAMSRSGPKKWNSGWMTLLPQMMLWNPISSLLYK